MNQYMYNIKHIYFWCRWCTCVYDCLCVWVGVYIHLLHSWLFHPTNRPVHIFFFLPGSRPEHLTHQRAPTTFRGIRAMPRKRSFFTIKVSYPTFEMAWGIDQKKRFESENIHRLILWMISFGGCCGWSWCDKTKVFANCAENVLGDLVMASAPGDGGCWDE